MCLAGFTCPLPWKPQQRVLPVSSVPSLPLSPDRPWCFPGWPSVALRTSFLGIRESMNASCVVRVPCISACLTIPDKINPCTLKTPETPGGLSGLSFWLRSGSQGHGIGSHVGLCAQGGVRLGFSPPLPFCPCHRPVPRLLC